MAQGKFITFEGGEGAGKSTQVSHLVRRLGREGIEVTQTREPGGSPKAEHIREILLRGIDKRLGPFAETLLFFEARDDHLNTTIRPALQAGRWVVCDRFTDSTLAYQGAAGGVSQDVLKDLERLIVGPTRPDLTIILDIPADQGLARANARRGQAVGADRFESMDLTFHKKLREAFLAIAKAEPARCVVVDARSTEAHIADEIWAAVKKKFGI